MSRLLSKATLLQKDPRQISCALKVEELIDDPDPNISRSAKNVLRKIKLRTNLLVNDLLHFDP